MLQPESSSVEDELRPYLRATNIQWSGIDTTDIKLIWFKPNELNQLSLQQGDLLISEGGDVGRSTLWNGELNNCYFQNSLNRVRAQEGNSTRFLYYWIFSRSHAHAWERIPALSTPYGFPRRSVGTRNSGNLGLFALRFGQTYPSIQNHFRYTPYASGLHDSCFPKALPTMSIKMLTKELTGPRQPLRLNGVLYGDL